MVISIPSMLVEPQDILCAEAVDALAPQAWDLKAEDLLSPLRIQEVKSILNPILSLCHIFWSLTRLGLSEVAVASPLGFGPSLAHFDRQLAAGEPLLKAFLPGFVLKVFIGLVVQLLMVLH